MIRIRHPQGVSTLKLEANLTLSALQSRILELTGIPPNEQELKSGYPPRSIPLHDVAPEKLISEAPLSISKGEQILVTQRKGARSEAGGVAAAVLPSADGTVPPSSSSARISAPAPSAPSNQSAAPQSSIPSAPSSSSKTPSAPTSSAAPSQPVRDGEVFVDHEGSALTLKVVPDDNSCLFASVGLISEQRIDSEVCQKLRKAVADQITSNPFDWSEAILGHAPSAYVSKILSPKTWGGAIELSILSRHLGVQLHAVDVSSGVVHRFGEDLEGADMKGYLVYSGIHYDALALLPTPEAPLEFGATLFPTKGSEGERSEQAVLKLVAELKKRRYYTDTATFALKCNACGTRLEGEKQAQEHALKTGHADFGEV